MPLYYIVMAAKRPVCKYGAECYRKNPDHLKNYYHPPKADEEPKVGNVYYQYIDLHHRLAATPKIRCTCKI